MSDDAPIDYARDVRRYANLQEAAKHLAPDLVMCDSCLRRTADCQIEGYAALCWPCNEHLIGSIERDN